MSREPLAFGTSARPRADVVDRRDQASPSSSSAKHDGGATHLTATLTFGFSSAAGGGASIALSLGWQKASAALAASSRLACGARGSRIRGKKKIQRHLPASLGRLKQSTRALVERAARPTARIARLARTEGAASPLFSRFVYSIEHRTTLSHSLAILRGADRVGDLALIAPQSDAAGHRRRAIGLHESCLDPVGETLARRRDHRAQRVGADSVRVRATISGQKCVDCGQIAALRG